MTCLAFFTVLVALVGSRAAGRAGGLQAQRRLGVARGGVESGRGHYPVMVVLHTGLLVGVLVEVWVRRPDVPAAAGWSMLVLVLAAQALRWWCIATLGPAVEHPGDRRTRAAAGARRALPVAAHPNYVAVVVEGFALPLVHAAWITALVFTVPTRCC